jgi:hypothetical protein
MALLKQFKEIEMLVLKEIVKYTIPMYFETNYIDFSKFHVRRENDNLILEVSVKEKYNTNVEPDAEKGRETQP